MFFKIYFIMKIKNLIAFVLLSSLLFWGCTPDSPTTPMGRLIEYNFTSSDPNIVFQVIYNNKDEIAISNFLSSGWNTTFSPTSLPFSSSLFVRNYTGQGGSNVSVTVKILVDGNVVSQSTKVLSNSNSFTNQIQFTVN